MSKVVFTGCSFTSGVGWVDVDPAISTNIDDKTNANLWVNLCHTQIDQLKNLDLINYGQGGASVTEIFKNTVQAIAEHKNDTRLLFCQWTSMPRYSFRVGFELWRTDIGIQLSHRPKFDVVLNRGDRWDRKYLDDLLNRLLVLHHLHGEIVKVVEYSSTLQKLAQAFGIKIYFVNGLCPWDQNYFVRLYNALPEDYTAFTKKEILNIESRDDNDIQKLYTIMHDEYDQVGGIDPANWVNLYSSMGQNKIDVNYDNLHPGIKSNQHYFQQVKQFLQSR
jgi:hypothetical protein